MKIDQIRKLKAVARQLKNLYPVYLEKSSKTRCDKHQLKFGGDTRFTIFKCPIALTGYLGYFGDSGCTTITNIDNIIAESLFNKAINRHLPLLLETMAEYAEREAATMVAEARDELAKLDALLDSVTTATETP